MVVPKTLLSGEKNPNYKNGNRMKGNYPCPKCGKDRICEGRRKEAICLQCYKASKKKNFNKLGWYQKNRHKLKKFCFEYKGGKCKRCEVSTLPLCCYHFHHRDSREKEFEVGQLFGSSGERGMEKIMNELEKCDMLCANCHLITHWEENYTE